MKNKDRRVLVDAMTQYLQLKGLTTAQERQMDGLKEVIAFIAQSNPDIFEDGYFVLEGVGVLKYNQNAPKLISDKTGKVLTDIEAAGLLSVIGAEYEKGQVSVTKVRDAIDHGDKKVITALKKLGVLLVQETRLDVKRL